MFEFATATRIIFGNGTVQQVPQLAMDMGNKILVVTGSHIERAAPLLKAFPNPCVAIEVFQVHGEPTVDVVNHGLEVARQHACNVVIGMGGGSALDAAKAISALLTNSGDLLDYLEVIGKGQQLVNPPIPFIAVPTTAGTGTEVTKNAVISSPAHRIKVSLRHNRMLPAVAVVDPELTISMPPAVTASTGLDAFTQVLEPFVSRQANPLTDAISQAGMKAVARSLLAAWNDGQNRMARKDMAFASLCGGLALANAGLGAVHGFAGPIGGMFPAPHGAICARLLPFVMTANLHQLRQVSDRNMLERFDEIGRILTADTHASADDGIEWIKNLCDQLKVPPLSAYGINHHHFPALIEKAKNASSMKGNPVVLPELTLIRILEQAT